MEPEEFDLKKELQQVIQNQCDRSQAFDKLDHKLVQNAKHNYARWNQIDLKFVGKVPLHAYYQHLVDKLGNDVVSYTGNPVYQIAIDIERLAKIC